LTKVRVIPGVNLSEPTLRGSRRNQIELAAVLERYAEPSILAKFDDILPDSPKMATAAAKKVALALYVWDRGPGYALFADRVVERVIEDACERADAGGHARRWIYSCVSEPAMRIRTCSAWREQWLRRKGNPGNPGAMPAHARMVSPDLLNSKEEVACWMARIRASEGFEVAPMPLGRSRAWSYGEGIIRHATGRFFGIIGLTWTEAGTPRWQPFIDFMVNTDAPSVLCTTDWKRLLGQAETPELPFRGDDGFSQGLKKSFCAPVRREAIEDVRATLRILRENAPKTAFCPLDAMPGCGWTPAARRP
jgi:hypothetical protein